METVLKIKSFTDLNAWKEGHRFVMQIYTLTKTFPREEIFGLVSQMRRCAVSITSNIAEGFSRNTAKDKNSFYTIALGSLTEIQNQLLIARDIGYLDAKLFQLLAQDTVTISKLMKLPARIVAGDTPQQSVRYREVCCCRSLLTEAVQVV